MKKTKKLLLITLTSLMLVSCSENTEDKYTDCRLISNYENFSQNGELFYSNNDKLVFIDFETLNMAPLCPYPNCLHNNPDVCPSYNMSSDSFIAGDKIFYFTKKVTYNSSGQPVSNIAVNSANLDGTEKRSLNTVNDAQRSMSAMFLDKDTVYFFARSCELDEFNIETGYAALSLISYNIRDNSFSTVCEAAQGYVGADRLIGMYNGEIYFWYICTDEKIDYLTVSAGNMPEVQMYKVNIETGEKTQIIDYMPLYALPDLFVYLKDGKTYIEQPDKELLAFDDFCDESSAGFFCVNDIFLSKGDGVLDLNNGSIYQLKEQYKKYDIIGYKNGEYIIRVYDNDAQAFTYEKATREMLLE